LAGAAAAVNAVSLYVEHGDETFRSVHVVAAERVARQARTAGLQYLAHVSGIGSDPRSSSEYIGARGDGELVVTNAFPEATLIRPAVMFGRNDALIAPLAGLLQRLPIFAMFGRGKTRLQPAFVDDVAQAIAEVTQRPDATGKAFECAGPRVYTYEELLRTIAEAMQIRARLMPMPFTAWHLIAGIAEWLPNPPITRNQVQLMEVDNVASAGAPGFSDLGIAPRSLEEILPSILPR
jgi:NADH dehydrogenase